MKPSDKERDKIRLQVFLSRSGVCSRRKAMTLIQQGQVTVNGKKQIEPSTLVDPRGDKIRVGAKSVRARTFQYILLNKPRGFITTKADRFAPKTVLDLLPKTLSHLHPVGRLDKNTEGLLLLTNDGSITQKLTHPKFHVDKTYRVRVFGQLQPADKDRLEKGIILDGKKTDRAKITKIKRSDKITEFFMTIHEGRKRQVRLMLAEVGHRVVTLQRITQGPLKLGPLKTGQFRELTGLEIQKLKKLPGTELRKRNLAFSRP